MIGWVTDEKDPRARILNAAPRGEPGDSFFNGGWRCAGAMWPGHPGEDKGDHLCAIPFYIANGDGDIRHCCYCRDCAERMGVPLP